MTLLVYRKLHTPKNRRISHTLPESPVNPGFSCQCAALRDRPEKFSLHDDHRIGHINRVAGFGHISVPPRLPEKQADQQNVSPKECWAIRPACSCQ